MRKISKHIFNKKCFLLCAYAFIFFSGFSQQLSISADRSKILLGEQVELQLKAEDINSRTTFLQNWFVLNDTAGHIQLVKQSSIDTLEVNGLTTYLQKITITSFDSGRWPVIMKPMLLQDRVSGKKTILATDSVFIDVLPVDVSEMRDYHPAKEILEVKTEPDYTLYIIIALTAIALAIAVWLLVKKFSKKKPIALKPDYRGTALEDALEQIKKLQQQNLAAKGDTKLFYTKLNGICRQYFSRQLNLQAHSTTDELMVTLIVYLQDEKRRTIFYQFLRLTDAVKFAKYIPGDLQNEEAVHAAVTSLQFIDQIIKAIQTK